MTVTAERKLTYVGVVCAIILLAWFLYPFGWLALNCHSCAKIQIGMTQQQVLSIMGSPDSPEPERDQWVWVRGGSRVYVDFSGGRVFSKYVRW